MVSLVYCYQIFLIFKDRKMSFDQVWENIVFGYCYHSDNGISYGLAQSDPIKRSPRYSLYVSVWSNLPSEHSSKVRVADAIMSNFGPMFV